MRYEIKIDIELEQPKKYEFIRGILHEKISVFTKDLQEFLNSEHGEVIEARRSIEATGVVVAESSYG